MKERLEDIIMKDYTSVRKMIKDNKNEWLKNIKDVLSNVVNNIKLKKKNEKKDVLSDQEVVKILKKEIKELNETIWYLEKAGNKENDIAICHLKIWKLEEYLPKMLSEEETKNVIESVKKELNIEDPSGKNKWLIIKYIKGHYDNIDLSLVSKLI